MVQAVAVDKKAGTITITLQMQDAKPSTSGKTLVVATTHGNVMTTEQVDGHSLVVGANVFYRP